MYVRLNRMGHGALQTRKRGQPTETMPSWEGIGRVIQKDADKQDTIHNQALVRLTSTPVGASEVLVQVWQKDLPELYSSLKELRTATIGFITAAYVSELKGRILQAFDTNGPMLLLDNIT
ncbi:hypothetical protein SARC_11927 [Sphaeroforma arctica JP610]|uniref:Uncharacterized protein n=1 Tax=Sphaeroforma arctica JP610 TaxID=667725 RepID=A0A0L0FFM0_9EUKA|nr:hypothetical protein SARC_11927 [Sphaeroforma arctica JP610]KNC75550.1 hypothetical protein SARC_11927 [Sphaeroforma arctica JP610]|eukprot:XP_014149452.1 hypothetical protein SARC_11927 [Sphaeroforma arctica JP610]